MNVYGSVLQSSSINKKFDEETFKLISSQVSSADDEHKMMLSNKNTEEIINYDLTPQHDNKYKLRFNYIEDI
jgi:hypothetical protein